MSVLLFEKASEASKLVREAVTMSHVGRKGDVPRNGKKVAPGTVGCEQSVPSDGDHVFVAKPAEGATFQLIGVDETGKGANVQIVQMSLGALQTMHNFAGDINDVEFEKISQDEKKVRSGDTFIHVGQ